jgi:hypothetical protein
MNESDESQQRRAVTAVDRELVEGYAAIEMVASGAAERMQLHGFPRAERVAAELAAAAQRAGVGFRLEHHEAGSVSLIIGPRRAELVR